MNFAKCFKCPLFLPRSKMTPVIASDNKGNRKKVLLCSSCFEKLKKQIMPPRTRKK